MSRPKKSMVGKVKIVSDGTIRGTVVTDGGGKRMLVTAFKIEGGMDDDLVRVELTLLAPQLELFARVKRVEEK